MRVVLGKYPKGNKPRKEQVRIHYHDIWSLDHTLALIIHPALVMLKEKQHGSPNTDDEDVPVELRSTSAGPKENEWDVDDNHFKRWEWILDEMIWTFDQLANERELPEDEFWLVKPEGMRFEELNDGSGHSKLVYDVEPVMNKEAVEAYDKRINNGLRLFGKYYRGLWD